MSRRCFHSVVVMLASAVVLAGCSLRTAEKVDVLVVGGSTSSVAAGLQSARMGAHTFIIEETDWLGGMLTGEDIAPETEIAKAKHRTLCYLYFLQDELGLDNETFPTEDRLPLIPYHRESRRIHGKVRFSLNHAIHPNEQPALYRTCIAMGDYPVGHHHTRYTGADSLLRASDLCCLAEYGLTVPDDKALLERTVSIAEAMHIVTGAKMGIMREQVEATARKYAWSDCDTRRPILRKEFAVWADELCNPFAWAIDIKGKRLNND